MNELLKHIEDGTLFTYTLSDGGTGIVIAENSEQAEEKVRTAYEKHGGYEGNNLTSVEINIFELYQKPFEDAPDVFEIFG